MKKCNKNCKTMKDKIDPKKIRMNIEQTNIINIVDTQCVNNIATKTMFCHRLRVLSDNPTVIKISDQN